MKSLTYLVLFVVAFQMHAQISDFDHINFQKADQNALECKNEGLGNLPQLAHKLTSDLTTDVERFRAIYRWVCNNIANDYQLYLKNSRKRRKLKDNPAALELWNDEVTQTVLKKLLRNKKTICTGYAYVVSELSKLANIDCEIVHGFGRTSTIDVNHLETPNHSWNAVKLEGKWYLCDPTWASGIPNPETNQFIFQYNDGFFLADPRLFAINHYPLDQKWLLMEDDVPSFEDFLAAPIIYGKAYTNLRLHNAPLTMHHTIQKHEKVLFKYQLKQTIDANEVRLLIDNGASDKKVTPQRTIIDNQLLTFDYQFDHTGFYDVHLYIGDDLISTYTVKVKS